MIKRKQIFGFLAPYCVAFERSVGAVVYRVQDDRIEYLLLKYRNGHWEFPRGKMEDEEMEIETMRREIWEETGIKKLEIIDGFRTLITFSYIAYGKEREERKADNACIFVRKTAIFYLAQSVEKSVVLSHEHQAAIWMQFDEALEKLTYNNAKRVLTQAQAQLEKKLKSENI
ncbi:MAG: diadenosine tetraphosphate hydrolase [Candidatus Moraniibacteriota bacterium]|nr:MAG: diadenosine tetraphosphate hydrolase [Candidatus Moranbacteria bacterium]